MCVRYKKKTKKNRDLLKHLGKRSTYSLKNEEGQFNRKNMLLTLKTMADLEFKTKKQIDETSDDDGLN